MVNIIRLKEMVTQSKFEGNKPFTRKDLFTSFLVNVHVDVL